jgi:type II pantothenate kinase
LIIGIDLGSTTTKAVAIDASGEIKKIKTKGMDATTSAAGAFGKIMADYDLKMTDIDRLMITGAGAVKIKEQIFGIPTHKVDEIIAIGLGGMFLVKKEGIVITNIGTGTAIIDARRDAIVHLGGTGVGGGTILGLGKKLLNTQSFTDIMQMAGQGDLSQVDLLMADIMDLPLNFLGKDATAANFGKMLDSATTPDIALGIINMVYQVIGIIAMFAARSRNTSEVVVTGNGSNNSIGRSVLNRIGEMYNMTFAYPEDAGYTTAIGACLYKE